MLKKGDRLKMEKSVTVTGKCYVISDSDRAGDPICIDSKHLKDKVPQENGTMCRVISVKLKQNPPPYKWKNYY